ncbi:hypothetical protein CIZ82_004148 [Escherichia coli]|nr:hypothetical protein [Escherichia coli]
MNSLLPSGSTSLERRLAQTCSGISDLQVPLRDLWNPARCSAQSDRSCGYCTGGRGAGCLEILATHHRISRWCGGRIQSGGRSHQCSIRTT